jgi:SAM-dependent methyltransferase
MKAYKKLSTLYYDISKPNPPENALKFYIIQLANTNEPVLEPMCGSGRFLIPLLKQGFDIDGVDASIHMLKSCSSRTKSIGINPNLYHQFLNKLNLPREYRIAFIPSGSFCLIVDRQLVIDSLQHLYNHLLPGGKLILEILTPRAKTKNPGRWIKSQVTSPENFIIMRSCYSNYNEAKKKEHVINKYESLVNNQVTETELEEYSVKYYESQEFHQLLELIGFIDIKVTKVYKDTEPGIKDEIIMFHCSKTLE